MQSVSDALRNERRDALVAYILHHDPPAPEIETPDQLYEYFLVDVQMDACMQTSRIRLALSTVQLFVTRCLMNLEPTVSPSSIRRRPLGVDEALPGVGGEPEGLPLPGELARAGAARRQVAVLPRARVRAAQGRHHRQDLAEDARTCTTSEARRRRPSRDRRRVPASSRRRRRPTTTSCTSSAARSAAPASTGTAGSSTATGRRGRRSALNIEGDLVVPVVWKNQLFVFWVTTVVQAAGRPGRSRRRTSPTRPGRSPPGSTSTSRCTGASTTAARGRRRSRPRPRQSLTGRGSARSTRGRSVPRHGVHAESAPAVHRCPSGWMFSARLPGDGADRRLHRHVHQQERPAARVGATTRSGCTSATRRRCSSSAGSGRLPQARRERAWTVPGQGLHGAGRSSRRTPKDAGAQ